MSKGLNSIMKSRRKKKKREPNAQIEIRNNIVSKKTFLVKFLANFGKKYCRVATASTPVDKKKTIEELNIKNKFLSARKEMNKTGKE